MNKPYPISVIACTRQRVGQLAKMLDSLHATAAGPVEVVLRVDFDDYETISYLAFRQVPFIVGSRLQGYATLSTLVNEAARLSTGDLVLVVNDDVEFCTPQWDRLLTTVGASYPDGLFDLGVETLNAGNFVFPCVSRRLIQILGGVFDERLIYPDIWLRDILQPFGRAIRVPEVQITHHWDGQTPDQQRACATAHSAEHQAVYQQCVIEGQVKIQEALQIPELTLGGHSRAFYEGRAKAIIEDMERGRKSVQRQ